MSFAVPFELKLKCGMADHYSYDRESERPTVGYVSAKDEQPSKWKAGKERAQKAANTW